MFDTVIRNGVVVDGTGAPRRSADIGITDGRITAIAAPGTLSEAARTVDADGRIVAPGFVDVHTHIDAQVFWDPALTPAGAHGVTSVMAGNCGFTLAPMQPDAADYLVRMLSVVEGMPLESLQSGVPLDWTSTEQYLDRLEGTLALNAGFMVGHSALRRVVMGTESNRRPATADEIDAMRRLLREGLEAGGLGFSSTWGPQHNDAEGRPVPSRLATADEMFALAGECGQVEGTSLEFIPGVRGGWDETHRGLMTGMSRAAARPLNWNVLRATVGTAKEAWDELELGTYARANGAVVTALLMPIPSRARFSFATGFVLDAIPGWGPVLSLPRPERLAALRDPAVRARLREGAANAGSFAETAQFDRRVITQVFSESLQHLTGRSVADLAQERGVDALEALLDVVCADDLMTTFSRPTFFPTLDDWKVMVEMLRGGRAVIGASDTGAHLDFIAYFDYPVYVIEHAVRRLGVLSLEEAVQMMTDVPARMYGLRDRGRLAEGAWADMVVFDETTVASGEMTTRFDLPAGAGRLYSEPSGIAAVLVNGVEIYRDGELTGARPGRVLRSGRDTATPAMSLS